MSALVQVAGADWGATAALLAAVAAVTGVPLTVIALYLRSIREHQIETHEAISARIDSVENTCRHLDQSLGAVERGYTTKSEWVRESMMARTQLDRLQESMVRMRTELECSRGLATQFVRATNAIIALTERLAGRIEQGGAMRDPRTTPKRDASRSA